MPRLRACNHRPRHVGSGRTHDDCELARRGRPRAERVWERARPGPAIPFARCRSGQAPEPASAARCRARERRKKSQRRRSVSTGSASRVRMPRSRRRRQPASAHGLTGTRQSGPRASGSCRLRSRPFALPVSPPSRHTRPRSRQRRRDIGGRPSAAGPGPRLKDARPTLAVSNIGVNSQLPIPRQICRTDYDAGGLALCSAEAARDAEVRCGGARLGGRSGRRASQRGSTSPKSQPPRVLGSVDDRHRSKASAPQSARPPCRLVFPATLVSEAAVPDKAGVRATEAILQQCGLDQAGFAERPTVPRCVQPALCCYDANLG